MNSKSAPVVGRPPVLHRHAVRNVREREPQRSLRRCRVAGLASAGRIASSIGSAIAAPRPLRNVLRCRCLPVMIMIFFRLLSSHLKR